MKASLGQTLFHTRSALAALWVLLLLAFSTPWISVWSALLFLPGLTLRFWAAGFIGPVSRNPKISTDSLMTRGPYSIVRHPLYIANALLVAAGLAMLRPHWILVALTALGFVVLYVLIGRAEERSLREHYGDSHKEYAARVTPFFPKRFEGPLFKGFSLSWALREWQTWLAVAALFGLAVLRATVIPALLGSWGILKAVDLSWLVPLAKAIVLLF